MSHSNGVPLTFILPEFLRHCPHASDHRESLTEQVLSCQPKTAVYHCIRIHMTWRLHHLCFASLVSTSLRISAPSLVLISTGFLGIAHPRIHNTTSFHSTICHSTTLADPSAHHQKTIADAAKEESVLPFFVDSMRKELRRRMMDKVGTSSPSFM